MSQWSLRIVLVSLFLLTSLVLWEKGHLHLTPSIRASRDRQDSTSHLQYPHVGRIADYSPQTQPAGVGSWLDYLGFDKKINTYYFTFYNWYHFEIEFADLGYESQIEFRTFTEDHLYDRWSEKIGFTLDEGFYPKGGKLKKPSKDGKGCCQKCGKGMNFDISTNVLNISVRQFTTHNSSGDRHDGYKYSRFWYYTPNRSLDDPQNEPFKGRLTVTTFNISYKGEKRVMEANLTHVLRHDHCMSFVDKENDGVLRHKCFGGYSNGRIFLDREIQHKHLPTYGKFVKSSFNLDNNRSRTFFEGVRSTGCSELRKSVLPTTNWHWKGFKAFMQCFSKPEYYSKHERIEKERYVGLHFSRPFAPAESENFQDYIWFNGKTHAIQNIDYQFNEKYKGKSNITFRGAPTAEIEQPAFEVNFTLLAEEKVHEEGWISERNERRAYGFWSGWVEEPEGERVNFFNITGYLQTTNSIY